jgi:perosamine synthetase
MSAPCPNRELVQDDSGRTGICLDARHAASELLAAAGNDRTVLSGIAAGGDNAILEEAFAQAVGAPFAVAVASGFGALYAALLASDVGPGDEVVVAAYGWGQTVAAVLAVGATPVFADVDPATGNLAPEGLVARIGPATRAVLVTHLFGCPAPMDELSTICRAHGLTLIADGAQAHGARWQGRPLGAWGDAVCYSLGAGKALSAGEGGLVVCHSPELFERLLLVSQHPLRCLAEVEGPDLRDSIGEFFPTNRIHPLAARIALAELSRLEQRIRVRRSTISRLLEGLDGLAGLDLPKDPPGGVHAYHQIVCRLTGNPDQSQGRVEALQARGIAVRRAPVRIPLHLRSPFSRGLVWYPKGLRPHRGHLSWAPGACPNAENCCRNELLIEDSNHWLAVPADRVDGMVTAFQEVWHMCRF